MQKRQLKEQHYFILILTAIISITGLEALVLLKGINGVIFVGVVAVIGGLVGYEVRRHHKRKP